MNPRVLGAVCAALLVISSAGCPAKKDAPGAGPSPEPSSPEPSSPESPAANHETVLPFDGMALSPTTTPALLAVIAESREHLDLESTSPSQALAVKATETAPTSVLAWLNRADVAISADDVALATARARALFDAQKGTATPAERLLLEVREARQVGDTDKALAAAEALVALAPTSPESHLVASRIHALRGEDERARTTAMKALELAPDSLGAHALLGESYTFREPRDLARAEHHFKKTVELRPGIAATYVSLGDVYRAGLDLEAASEQYGKAMAADPGYPVSSVKRGHVNSFLGHHDQARADYDKGIAVGEPRIALSLSNYRAFVSAHAGKPEDAIAELKALHDKVLAAGLPASEQHELETYTLGNRAIIALLVADMATGRLAGKPPGKPDGKPASENSGNALQTAVAAVTELIETYQRIASETRDPHDKHTANGLAAYWKSRRHLARGELEPALEQARSHHDLVEADSNPRKFESYHELLGLIALARGQYGDAIEHLRQADLQSEVFARYHLAIALDSSGQSDEARKLFREVADHNFNSADYAVLRKLARERAGGK